jgi:hypothetical protein
MRGQVAVQKVKKPGVGGDLLAPTVSGAQVQLQAEHGAHRLPDGGGAHEGPAGHPQQSCAERLLPHLQRALPHRLQDRQAHPHLHVLQQHARTQRRQAAGPQRPHGQLPGQLDALQTQKHLSAGHQPLRNGQGRKGIREKGGVRLQEAVQQPGEAGDYRKVFPERPAEEVLGAAVRSHQALLEALLYRGHVRDLRQEALLLRHPLLHQEEPLHARLQGEDRKVLREAGAGRRPQPQLYL